MIIHTTYNVVCSGRHTPRRQRQDCGQTQHGDTKGDTRKLENNSWKKRRKGIMYYKSIHMTIKFSNATYIRPHTNTPQTPIMCPLRTVLNLLVYIFFGLLVFGIHLNLSHSYHIYIHIQTDIHTQVSKYDTYAFGRNNLVTSLISQGLKSSSHLDLVSQSALKPL